MRGDELCIWSYPDLKLFKMSLLERLNLSDSHKPGRNHTACSYNGRYRSDSDIELYIYDHACLRLEMKRRNNSAIPEGRTAEV